ncbi:phospholipase D-like domain-containing protein [Hymenobacter sp. BT770]|uniref:phospholipase D-like domain-containing protein n=1 Tax=Hymenobacter sp. BT770 TaxID=2886942 RepID=UPI001D105995|nr:phospholipase D-like domain-containing protein [Hymenobacter sp. BT770]MCC3154586.1 phospholipase D-like domain-containing protein [Hymenobacter sp. BT770]MDO3416640.1 phospholipase D-like domain-containing protein [Hymenobacter sp. BT770]
MAIDAHFTGIRAAIQNELSQATSSIRVAVAWFTDQTLFTTLLEKLAAEVSVLVVIRNDVINLNPTGIDWQQLIDAGGTLFFSQESPHLHHKLCVVDDKKVISGSYNWTYGAQRNQENIVVSDQHELVKSFRAEFDNLLSQAEEVSNITQTAAVAPPATNSALEYEALMEIEYKNKDEASDRKKQSYRELVLAGNAAYFQKRYDEAESYLQQALALKQDGIDAHEILAGLYWRTEQFQKSVDIAKKAEALGLKSAELWNALGLAYDGLKQFREAIHCFDQAIKLAPHLSTPYRNKFISQQGNRQTKDADLTALEGGRIATEAIRKYKNGGNNDLLLHAYMDRAFLHSDLPEARKHAQEALALFNRIPVKHQDMHDLEDINAVLNEKPRF